METNAYFIPLRPRWPGLLSHPHSLSRLGSQGWTVPGLRELGSRGSRWAFLGSVAPGPPSTGPQTPDPGWASHSYCKPTAPQNWWMPWAWRAMKSYSCLMSPGGGVCTSSLPPWSPSTKLWHHPQQSTFLGLRFDWKVKGKEDEVVSPWLFLRHFSLKFTIQVTKALITQSWVWRNVSLLWPLLVTTTWKATSQS